MQLTLSTSPDAWGNSLLRCLVRAFDAMGGAVILDNAGENLIRARRTDESHEFGHVIEAQGLPNLVHEFVHAYRHGRLQNDSGFDYSKIPLNPHHPRDGLDLWDEITACVISCDWLPPLATEEEGVVPHDKPRVPRRSDDNTRNASTARTQAISADSEQRSSPRRLRQAADWFAEQLEILPVFYGLEQDFLGFLRLVETHVVQAGHAYNEFETLTRARLVEALAHFGQRNLLVDQPRPLGFQLLWNEYLKVRGQDASFL